MELRGINNLDYQLILHLDAKVYPVSEENKINEEIVDRWYSKFPKYGMIYVNKNTNGESNDIVAMAIAIPMPLKTWNELIKGECFENTLNIEWSTDSDKYREKLRPIGIHIYHIEVLNRSIVGKNFYKRMLKDISCISNYYQHQIEGISGYCVTPNGNHLFQNVFCCHNADQDILSMNNTTNTPFSNNTLKTQKNENEPTSEFIIQHPITKQIKIVECLWNTDLTQPYLDESVQPPQLYPFISKCNMLYTLRKTDYNTSPVWTYL
ncbi:hypothetical protein BCR36DRAFT_412208 [Piromyces finnis]|uniref:Uncharacterized protein n=1 Tax=Piromyces finnis TaxID=1754191 RepID=A0A1Y1V9Z5_9FUNG|nr:hypothetical protein BCR36DRAFT_412208 [Piromyces finnis]|eukprot:ORX50712.1 hypothetical protein BCR36DRAFT_412208 [Piromyces finnis]